MNWHDWDFTESFGRVIDVEGVLDPQDVAVRILVNRNVGFDRLDEAEAMCKEFFARTRAKLTAERNAALEANRQNYQAIMSGYAAMGASPIKAD